MFVILALGLSDEKYHLIILVSFSLYLFSDDLYCFDIILVWTVSLKEIYYLLVVFPFVIYNKFILEFIVISLGPFWSDGLPEVFCPFSFIYCVLPLADVIMMLQQNQQHREGPHPSLPQSLPAPAIRKTVPEHQSPLRQTAQQLFPPGCESPGLKSPCKPLPPETWTPPPPPLQTPPNHTTPNKKKIKKTV